MLKKISEKRDRMSKEKMKSIRGGIYNPVLCLFQCISDCNSDEQIYYSTGAYWGAQDEIEIPL